MRKSRSILCAVSLWAYVASAALMAGCGEADSRQAGRDVSEKVRWANAHIQNAAALLANPPIKVGEDFLPLPGREGERPAAVEVAKSGTLNPKVLEELDAAQKILTESLQAGADAPAAQKARAQAALGQALAMRGDYHATEAKTARVRAADAVDEAGRLLSQMQLQRELVEHYKKLIGISNEAGEEILSANKARAVELDEEIEAVKRDIEKLRAEQKKLLDESEKLIREGTTFRVESRLATGEKVLELFEEAVARDIAAKRAAVEANELELQIAFLNNDRRVLEARQSSAKDIIAAMTEVLKSHVDQTDAYRKVLQQRQDDLAEITRQIESLAKEIAKQCKVAATAESGAEKAYDSAIERFSKSQRLKEVAATVTQQAGASMAVAELYVDSLELQGQITRILSQAPAAAGRITYVPNPQEAERQAKEYYKRAVELYARVVAMTPHRQKWAAQGQLAYANIRLYALTREPTVRRRAEEVLNKALAGREASRYLESVVALKKHLVKL
ncbi:MAG: hypothetical protein KAU28_05120 [Phycisphaerae bacterium]|nr:hypothetical protein [Phycisphaerae bacterium]